MFNLDVDTPDAVPIILRRAAQEFYESAEDLSASWQDRESGKVWSKIAKILERAADQIDKVL